MSGCIFSATYNISGQVVDFEGNGIEAANILVSGNSNITAETDVEGNFTLVGLNGSVQILVEKEGYVFGGPNTVSSGSEEVVIRGLECNITFTGEGTVNSVLNETDEVTLQAVPADGWTFIRWEGDLESVDNPVSMEIDGPINVTAVFYDFYTAEGNLKWAPELNRLSGFWSSVYDREDFVIDSCEGYLKVTMSSTYDYAGLDNVIIPANATQVRVTVIDASAGITTGLWRLRFTHKDTGVTQNIAGGVIPQAECVQTKDIATASLNGIQAGDSFRIDLGGNWTAGEWAIFQLEILDEAGNPLTSFL